MDITRSLKYLACIVILLALLAGPMKVIWMPWLSLKYSAELLAEDDGLGLVTWAPEAAKHWGVAIVQPLSTATNGFSSIKSVAAFTLMDIVETASQKDAGEVAPSLLQATSPSVRYIGLLAAHRAGTPFRSPEALIVELQQEIKKPPLFNTTEAVISIEVAGRIGIQEISDALIRNLNTALTPSMVASASCVAAGAMHSRPELIAALRTAVSRKDFPYRAACEQSLGKLIANQHPVGPLQK